MVDGVNEVLVLEMLDLMVNDSENLERTLKHLTDDCVWVMEPGGTEYHGMEQLRTYIEIAMSSRGHDTGTHRIEVLNWFTAGENLCIEYTHGLVSTGKLLPRSIGGVEAGVLRYCITYHIRDGKFDRVHEYINSTSVLWNFFMPILLGRLHRRTMKKLAGSSSK